MTGWWVDDDPASLVVMAEEMERVADLCRGRAEEITEEREAAVEAIADSLREALAGAEVAPLKYDWSARHVSRGRMVEAAVDGYRLYANTLGSAPYWCIHNQYGHALAEGDASSISEAQVAAETALAELLSGEDAETDSVDDAAGAEVVPTDDVGAHGHLQYDWQEGSLQGMIRDVGGQSVRVGNCVLSITYCRGGYDWDVIDVQLVCPVGKGWSPSDADAKFAAEAAYATHVAAQAEPVATGGA